MTAVVHDPLKVMVSKQADELRQIPLEQLLESPWNPRKHFDPARLAEMVESLKKGQLAPIIVRPIRSKLSFAPSTAQYEIGAGHRRYRSAPKAGMTSLLAIVRDLDDVAFLELLTIENKQRDDVEPLDEANGFKLLMEKAGYDVAKLAMRIGLSTKYVYDRLKLLQLVPAAKQLLEDGVITPGHAILLARLSPADQKRAIGHPRSADVYSMNSQTGGLFRPEHVEGELRLEGGRAGVRSVRELQQWIYDNVRMRPETVDPFLFPETAQVLIEAKENKDKVVHITYEHFCPDGAKDRNERTYGKNSWKRADGRGGKKCDRSVIGHVVAGPHQGDAFRVCVNRDRCKVHFKESATRFARRQKDAKPLPAIPHTEKPPTAAEQERERARREREAARWKAEQEREAALERAVPVVLKQRAPAIAKRILAIRKGLRVSPAMAAFLWREGLEPIEQDIIGGSYGNGSRYGDEITDVVLPLLPGKTAKDFDGQLSYIAMLFWFSRETKGLDKEIGQAAAALVDAEMKAKAKAAAKKKGGR